MAAATEACQPTGGTLVTAHRCGGLAPPVGASGKRRRAHCLRVWVGGRRGSDAPCQQAVKGVRN